MTFFDIFKPQTPGLTERFANRDDVSVSMAGDPAAIASFLHAQRQRETKPTAKR